MSEVKVSEIAAFFRYLVPGISLVTFIALSVPWRVLAGSVSQLDGSLVAVITTSVAVLFGWLSYHMIYPGWKGVLSVLGAYPRSRVMNDLDELVQGKNLRSSDLWSFFLWNHCKDSVRERVKQLANYGHSLYMVSFSFFALPLIYATSRSALDRETVLVHLFAVLLPEDFCHSNLPFLELLFLLLSFLLGTVLAHFGYRRIQYAEGIQWILYKSGREKIMKILGSTGGEEMQLSKQAPLSSSDQFARPPPDTKQVD